MPRPPRLDPRTAERAGRWVQMMVLGDEKAWSWCLQHQVSIKKTQAEGIDSAGGFLVPTEIEEAIIALRDVVGIFRSRSTVRRMGSDARSFPRRQGGITAYFTAEQAAAQESQAVWDNVELVARKLGVLTRLSAEVWEDEAVDLGNAFLTEIAYAFALREDDCGFNGDGTLGYGGIRGILPTLADGSHHGGVLAASGHNTFLTLDSIDLGNLVGALPSYALESSVWLASPLAIATCFVRLTIEKGGYTLDDQGRWTYLGIPIVVSSKLPAVSSSLSGQAMLLLGDLSMSSLMGDRRGTAVATSRQRLLENDQVMVRGTERFDIVNHALGDATSAGPVVAMIGG